MTEQYVGVDVSKGRLDIAVRSSGDVRSFHVTNTPSGTKGLAKQLSALAPAGVVMEASGGYERDAWQALDAAGIPVAVVNPRQTKHFGVAIGHKDKTDKVDALVLAEFAQRVRPQPTPAPDAETEALRALVSRRHQLVAMRSSERTRLRQLPPSEQRQARALIRVLDRQVAGLDRNIRGAIKARPEWAEKDRLLRGIKGPGPILSAMVIAYLPEAGHIPHKKLASLVGVAPYARDSGAKSGRRRIWGGRSEVRHVLYMASLAAIRSNPAVRTVYKRLRAKQKLPKVAIVACMHKLLRVLNAVLRDRVDWNRDWGRQLLPNATPASQKQEPTSPQNNPSKSPRDQPALPEHTPFHAGSAVLDVDAALPGAATELPVI